MFKTQSLFFSKARGTGTEREPKAGVEWRCPALSKKSAWVLKIKQSFCFSKPFFQVPTFRKQTLFKNNLKKQNKQKKQNLLSSNFFSELDMLQKKNDFKLVTDLTFIQNSSKKTTSKFNRGFVLIFLMISYIFDRTPPNVLMLFPNHNLNILSPFPNFL